MWTSRLSFLERCFEIPCGKSIGHYKITKTIFFPSFSSLFFSFKESFSGIQTTLSDLIFVLQLNFRAVIWTWLYVQQITINMLWSSSVHQTAIFISLSSSVQRAPALRMFTPCRRIYHDSMTWREIPLSPARGTIRSPSIIWKTG